MEQPAAHGTAVAAASSGAHAIQPSCEDRRAGAEAGQLEHLRQAGPPCNNTITGPESQFNSSCARPCKMEVVGWRSHDGPIMMVPSRRHGRQVAPGVHCSSRHAPDQTESHLCSRNTHLETWSSQQHMVEAASSGARAIQPSCGDRRAGQLELVNRASPAGRPTLQQHNKWSTNVNSTLPVPGQSKMEAVGWRSHDGPIMMVPSRRHGRQVAPGVHCSSRHAPDQTESHLCSRNTHLETWSSQQCMVEAASSGARAIQPSCADRRAGQLELVNWSTSSRQAHPAATR